MQNKTACVNNTCVYTVDLPPSICSTSDPNGADVAVSVAAVNVLGFGQLTESITIGTCMHAYHNNILQIQTKFIITRVNVDY